VTRGGRRSASGVEAGDVEAMLDASMAVGRLWLALVLIAVAILCWSMRDFPVYAWAPLRSEESIRGGADLRCSRHVRVDVADDLRPQLTVGSVVALADGKSHRVFAETHVAGIVAGRPTRLHLQDTLCFSDDGSAALRFRTGSRPIAALFVMKGDRP
jgi:hypothetical protein